MLLVEKLLAAALLLSAPARAADAPVPAVPAAVPAAAGAAPAPDASGLDDLARQLLATSGYEIRPDGTVWDKIADTAVPRGDLPFLLSRLASASRLKALLQINNIINRYDQERKLTDEDREAVRVIARANWPIFGLAPRHDFRAYFNAQELETLDVIPVRYERMSVVHLTDPEPESITAAAPAAIAPAAVQAAPAAVAPAAAPAVAAAAPAAVAAAPAKVIPTLTPLMAAPDLSRGSRFTVTPAAPPPAPLAAVPTPVVPAAAIRSTFTVQPDLGVAKPWVPPAEYIAKSTTAAAVAASTVTAAAPVAAATAAVAAVAPPAPPPPPKPAGVSAEEFDKFVAEGPYTKEGKALLALIGKRAPEFCLPLLRRTVVAAVPQIAFDGARTGESLRAALLRDPGKPDAPPVVALSPGPIFLEVKKGFLGGRRAVVLLPESPEAWTALGLTRPAYEALKADAAPAAIENGDWGAVRAYKDGSRRGAYSAEEQAGELLEQLLRLGLSREGLDASPYAARRWARAARLMYAARLKEDARQDAFLDPDRRAELREWLDHPEESDDLTAAVWSGGRVQALDPRRGPPEAQRAAEEAARSSCARSALADALAAVSRRRARRVGTLETLVDAGAADGAAAKAAAAAAAEEEKAERAKLLQSPPACPAAEPGRDESLRRSSSLAAEAARAEKAWREKKAGAARAL